MYRKGNFHLIARSEKHKGEGLHLAFGMDVRYRDSPGQQGLTQCYKTSQVTYLKVMEWEVYSADILYLVTLKAVVSNKK